MWIHRRCSALGVVVFQCGHGRIQTMAAGCSSTGINAVVLLGAGPTSQMMETQSTKGGGRIQRRSGVSKDAVAVVSHHQG